MGIWISEMFRGVFAVAEDLAHAPSGGRLKMWLGVGLALIPLGYGMRCLFTGHALAEDLAHAPSGGRLKMWLLGVGLALIPLGYGMRCLFTGHARFFGRGADLNLDGSAALALAIAYIAVGVFMHAHWFWGLHPRLEPSSYLLKGLALLVFLGSLGYTMFRIIM
jgi:hypothetical protein